MYKFMTIIMIFMVLIVVSACDKSLRTEQTTDNLKSDTDKILTETQDTIDDAIADVKRARKRCKTEQSTATTSEDDTKNVNEERKKVAQTNDDDVNDIIASLKEKIARIEANIDEYNRTKGNNEEREQVKLASEEKLADLKRSLSELEKGASSASYDAFCTVSIKSEEYGKKFKDWVRSLGDKNK